MATTSAELERVRKKRVRGKKAGEEEKKKMGKGRIKKETEEVWKIFHAGKIPEEEEIAAHLLTKRKMGEREGCEKSGEQSCVSEKFRDSYSLTEICLSSNWLPLCLEGDRRQ